MGARICSRSDDEAVLEMIDLRARGFSSGEIGRLFGLRPEAVRTRTDRVRRDDISHDPAAEAFWT